MSGQQGPAPPASPGGIHFHNEDRAYRPSHPARLKAWIQTVIRQEHHQLRALSVIFCSDDYLHRINRRYLDHDTFTDIISFPYADPPWVEGDIFISLDRVRENAHAYGLPWQDELHRVMIHGVLHFCGYGDASPDEKERMRAKEDAALRLLAESD